MAFKYSRASHLVPKRSRQLAKNRNYTNYGFHTHRLLGWSYLFLRCLEFDSGMSQILRQLKIDPKIISTPATIATGAKTKPPNQFLYEYCPFNMGPMPTRMATTPKSRRRV
jgi:hypothetical protein